MPIYVSEGDTPPAGLIDHNGLLNLAVGDVHPQYHTDGRADIRYQPNSDLVAYVTLNGEGGSFTTIAAAEASLVAKINIVLGIFPTIRLGSGTFLENYVPTEGIQLVGEADGSSLIGGDATVGDDIVTLGGYSSIANVAIIAAQVNKRSAINLITATAAPLVIDPRASFNIRIESGLPNTITTAFRNEATNVGAPQFMVHSCPIILPGTNMVETVVGSTAEMKLVSCISSTNGALQLDGTGTLEFIACSNGIGFVVINRDKVFRPIASRYGQRLGTSGDATGFHDDLASVGQFQLRGASGVGFPVGQRVDSNLLSLVNRTGSYISKAGRLSVGDFIVGVGGGSPDGRVTGESLFSFADVKMDVASASVDAKIKFNCLDPIVDTAEITIPVGTDWITGVPIKIVGQPTPNIVTGEYSAEITQIDSNAEGIYIWLYSKVVI